MTYSYVFLLNNTRGEAILLPDETEPAWQKTKLTTVLGHYQVLIKDWTFADDIDLYQTDTIRHYKLSEYKCLNFEIYNKEVHFL